jgi:hypothetical protein
MLEDFMILSDRPVCGRQSLMNRRVAVDSDTPTIIGELSSFFTQEKFNFCSFAQVI